MTLVTLLMQGGGKVLLLASVAYGSEVIDDRAFNLFDIGVGGPVRFTPPCSVAPGLCSVVQVTRVSAGLADPWLSWDVSANLLGLDPPPPFPLSVEVKLEQDRGTSPYNTLGQAAGNAWLDNYRFPFALALPETTPPNALFCTSTISSLSRNIGDCHVSDAPCTGINAGALRFFAPHPARLFDTAATGPINTTQELDADRRSQLVPATMTVTQDKSFYRVGDSISVVAEVDYGRVRKDAGRRVQFSVGPNGATLDANCDFTPKPVSQDGLAMFGPCTIVSDGTLNITATSPYVYNTSQYRDLPGVVLAEVLSATVYGECGFATAHCAALPW